MKLGREFFFDAAHFLPNYKGKCEKLHGHTYKFEVIIEGEIGKKGMVIDFNTIKKIVEKKILKKLDHGNLNSFFKNPTAEIIAKWIFNELKRDLPFLHSIKLWEGEGKWVLVEKREK